MEAYDNLAALLGKPISKRKVEEARKLLPLVEEERTKGFSLFNGLAALGVWSALEAFVDDLLLAFIPTDPSALATNSVKKLKVPLLEFHNMSEETRTEWIVDEMKSQLGTSRKPGVGKFEALLDAFTLGGPIDEECRACLLELSAIRNVLAHRNGRADDRFTSLCPWLGLRRGEEVLVGRGMLTTYGTAVLVYGTVVYRRVLVRSEQPTRPADLLLEMLPPVRRTFKVDANPSEGDEAERAGEEP